MVEETDVIIVGGGPIGLTLSYILSKHDINHVLLEQNTTTSKWPKAMLTNTRSMELYRRLGVDTLFREREVHGGQDLFLTQSYINKPPVAGVSLMQFTGKNLKKKKDGSYIFEEKWTNETVCRISQRVIEPILKAESNKSKCSDLRFGYRVESVSQTEDEVEVEAVAMATGEKKVFRAAYLVGCDGGKSFVRKSLGIHFQGKFDLARYQSVSFRSPVFMKRLVSDGIITFMAKPGVFALLVRLDDKGDFVIHFLTPTKVEAQEIIKLAMDGEELPYTLLFENQWQGHFAYAEEIQNKRIFLAGDSCHIVVPVGGFGMNTGILDAYDIGWKLVGVLKGWGGEHLLSSYAIERSYGIRKLVGRIEQLFHEVLTYMPILGFFLTTRPFKYIARLFLNPMNLNINISGVLFGVRLETSPICIPCGLPLPPVNPLVYKPQAYAGCRAPYFEFKDGTNLYDKLGSLFTLLVLQPSNQDYDPLLAAAAHCGIPLKVVYFNDRALKKLYRGMDLVIIRPDLYIAWCGNELPTLLHADDVNSSARVLMKVISGSEVLPQEWKRPDHGSTSTGTWCGTWCWPLMTALAITGVSLTTTFLFRHLKTIK